MLNVMRENLRSLKWLLWAVAFSMVAYLGAYFSCGDSRGTASGPWAAKVGAQEVSIKEFQEHARSLDQRYRQVFGTQYQELRPQLKLGTQAIQTLIDRHLILDDARAMGIEITADDLAREIKSDPQFMDQNGNFIGTARYVDLVDRGYPGGVAAYETGRTNDMMVDRWSDAVTQSLTVSDSEAEDLYRRRNVRTSVDYVLFPSSTQKVSTDVSDADLHSWYDAHPEDYTRQDSREVRMIVLDREAQREGIEISDEDLRAAYEANQANYTHPEQRRASHILIRVEPDASADDKKLRRGVAEQLRARAASGEDFADLAKATSQDPTSAPRGGDLGWFGRGDMVPAFDEAAFSTPVGELSPVVETQFGFHIIKVTGSREAGVTPLAEVADELRRSLQVRRAQEKVVSEAQRVSGEIGSAADLENVAAEEGLEVTPRTIAHDDTLRDLGAGPDFIDAIFALPEGSVSAPLRVARGMAIVAVDRNVPASVAPFDEVRADVKSDVLNERAHDLAVATARKALDAGRDLPAIASRNKLEVKQSGELAPGQDLPGTGGAADLLKAELFGPDVTEGSRGVIRVPAGALLFSVTARTSFDATAFANAEPDLRRELIDQQRDVVVRSVLDRLREDSEIVVNQEVVGRIDG